MSKHVFLADNKMANISLDVHTFIAQNLPKYHFQSSLYYTFLSLTSSRREYYIFSGPACGIIFSENQKKILAINNFFCQWNEVRTTK